MVDLVVCEHSERCTYRARSIKLSKDKTKENAEAIPFACLL